MVAGPEQLMREVPEANQQTGMGSDENVQNGHQNSGGVGGRPFTGTLPAQQLTGQVRV